MPNDLASVFGSVYPPMQATPERTHQAILRDRQAQLEQQRLAEFNQSLEPASDLADLFTMAPRGLRDAAIVGRTPDWRENTQQASGGMAEAISGKSRSEAARDTGSIMSVTDWLPGTGDVSDVMDVGQSLSEGNYGEAGLGALLAAVPFVPAKKTINTLKDVKREGARKTVSDIVDAVMGNTSKAVDGLKLKPANEAAVIRGPEETDFDPAAADVLADATESPDPRAGGWKPQTPPEPGKYDPLPGSPTAPVKSIVDTADTYAQQKGINLARQPEYARADPIRGGWIADEYEAMQHNPNDPATRAAYQKMADETLAQWEVLKKTGIQVQFVKPGQPHPYAAGPKAAIEDLRNNNHLWVDPTDQGFGSGNEFDPGADHPLLQKTGEVIDGHPVVVNDIFRIVHDAFGHGMEGANFGPRGEENAWQAHSRLFSPEALGPVTNETRGQNSWVNFGPHGEANRANPRETVFADQKTGTLPTWATDPEGMKPGYEPQVDATWGNRDNEGALFEGVRPSEFTPDQMYRYGKQYGVDDLGPPDTQKWIDSLQPMELPDGRVVYIPGGLESKEPFTYYDKLFMKQQGINPNDLDDITHGQIYDRFISSYMKNPPSDEAVFNQLLFAMISPNQPLSENELALARTMIKGPEDLKKFAASIPWNYKDANSISPEQRRQASQDITKMLGIAGKDVDPGGLSVPGSADYSRMAEFAQKYLENPQVFRFKGAGEGGANATENWSNFADRVANMVSGLGSKTASLGTVWQSPGTAAISAVDRHMLDKFGDAMFDTPKEFRLFQQQVIDKFNTTPIKGKGPNAGKTPKQLKKAIKTWDQLPKYAQHEALFAKVNAHPQTQYIDKKTGQVSAKVPEHLSDLPFQPTKGGGKTVQMTSEPYKKVNAATAASAQGSNLAPEDQRSVFAEQWRLWDRIRQRLEPHEITHMGLEKLPRMSLDEIKRVKADMEGAGYMKKGRQPDPGSGIRKMQPVQPTPSNRKGFASRGAYWSAVPGAGIGLGAIERMNRDDKEREKKGGT